MKPVFLRFAGLHSYIEEQQIDFTELLGAGVFGIFGPTGSGKSTILDAITLALYGTVERAPRKTKEGIINQYCTQAAVAFTFDLQDATGVSRYRVERTFRRSKVADSAEAVQARFVQLAPGEPGTEEVQHVLADKASTVSTAVVEVLGLNVDDFTRAVVLPQGKFAEFLGLQGSERCKMLQRLFGLELYGDRLMQQVKLSLQADQAALDSLQARIADLGDASPAAVQAAAKLVLASEAARVEAAAAALQVEQEYDQWERVWGWQQELVDCMQRMAKLAEAAEAVDAQERELTAAKRAELVRSPLIAVAAALAESQTAEATLLEALQNMEQTAVSLEVARKRLAAAESAWEAESPSLYARQADLRRAVALESELERGRSELAEMQTRCVNEQNRLSALTDAAERLMMEKSAAEAELERIRTELMRRVVDPAQRAGVLAAISAMQSVAAVTDQLEKEQRELASAELSVQEADTSARQAQDVLDSVRVELAALQQKKAEHLQSKPVDEQELQFRQRSWQNDARIVDQMRTLQPLAASAQKEVARLTAELAQIDQQIGQCQAECIRTEAALLHARDELATAERAVLAAQQANMAAALASNLTPGAPCPVCGSSHHPHPATLPGDSQTTFAQQALDEKRTALQQAEDAHQRALAGATQAAARHQAQQEALEKATLELRRLEDEINLLRPKLPQVWQQLDVAGLAKALAQEETRLQEQAATLQLWQSATSELESALQDMVANVAAADKDNSTKRVALDSAQKAQRQVAARVASITAQLAQEQAKLAQESNGMSVEQIRRLHDQFIQWDHESSDLRRQESDFAARLKDAIDRASAAQKEAEETRLLLAQLQSDYQSRSRRLAELDQEIRTLIGSEHTAAATLATVNSRLEQLMTERNQAAEDEAASGRAHQQSMQAYAGAEQRVTSAKHHYQAVNDNLTTSLAQSGFATSDLARAALRTPEEQERLQASVQMHRQAVENCQRDKERIQKALAGRTITMEEWQAWQQRLSDARSARDTALQAAAIAKDNHRDLVQRNQRWNQLTQEADKLNDRVNRLQDLSSLLRGNAFVDFLAEQQLQQVAYTASEYLGQLTRYRYALQVASDGSFVIQDNTSGGYHRAVHTLSGGETFLTSLGLALALSSQIQLHGRYPLQFFFLDEGFGALDQELLEVAMTALERLQMAQLHVGVISHVPELRNRIMRRLLVTPAVPGERGSKIAVDQA